MSANDQTRGTGADGLDRTRSGRPRPVLFATLALGALLAACGDPEPEGWRRPQSTEEGHYRVTLASGLDPIEINRIHEWTVTVVGSDGRPVEGAQIELTGGMPEHQHGLPTVPEMTADLGEGRYRIEGMKFNMHGWWQLTLDVRTKGVRDAVTFDVVLE